MLAVALISIFLAGVLLGVVIGHSSTRVYNWFNPTR